MTTPTREKRGERRHSLNGEKEGVKMNEDLKESILKYLGTVSQAKNKDVARAVGQDKHIVDKAIAELAKEGKIEYRSFGGITYLALPGKKET
jgi:Mn-dependent DtxR family transcriptional regulator